MVEDGAPIEGVPPLRGLTVVELCQSVAGPYAGLVLGALGATVIKVERPGTGDDTRSWAPPRVGDHSVMFEVMNAGKTSRFLDLRRDEDRETLLGIVDDADVLLQNWRPGAIDRLGFDYQTLAERNPGLVYCSLTGYGTSGPYAMDPGYDPIIQAFSGLMAVTGHPDQAPVRVGTSVIDMGSGMWMVIAVLAALHERAATGLGTRIDCSLLETGLAWLPYQSVAYMATGQEPSKMGSALAMLAPYQVFATADGDLAIAVGNDRQWHSLCAALDRDDLARDPELTTNPGRVAHRGRLERSLEESLAERSADEWAQVLRARGVPCAIVQTVGAALGHPQTEASGFFGQPDRHGVRMPGLPLRMAGWRPRPSGGAPDMDPTSDDRTGAAAVQERGSR